MEKVYLLKVHNHNGGYHHSSNDNILTAIDSLDESKRQYIKDTIETYMEENPDKQISITFDFSMMGNRKG